MNNQLFLTLKEFKAPLLSAFFSMIGCGFYTTYISIIFEIQDYHMLQIGLVHSAFFAGLLFGAWKIQKMIHQIGHIQSLSVFCSLGAAVILLQGMLPNYYLWIITRFIGGVSMAAIYVGIESWILEQTNPKERGMVLGLNMAALSAGCGLGQKAIPLLDIHCSMPFLFASLLFAMSIIPMSLSTKKIQITPNEDFLHFDKLYEISPLGFSACIISGLIISASFSFLPVYGNYAKVPPFDTVFYFVIGGAVLLWPLGKISDHFDKRKFLIFLGFFLSLASIMLYMNTNTHPIVASIVIFLYGGICYALYPIGLAMLCERIKSGSFTQIAASILIFYGIGSVFGPIFASIPIHAIGGSGLFLFTVSLAIGFSCAVFFLPQTRDPVSINAQLGLITAPKATRAALGLSPIPKEIDDTRKQDCGSAN